MILIIYSIIVQTTNLYINLVSSELKVALIYMRLSVRDRFLCWSKRYRGNHEFGIWLTPFTNKGACNLGFCRCRAAVCVTERIRTLIIKHSRFWSKLMLLVWNKWGHLNFGLGDNSLMWVVVFSCKLLVMHLVLLENVIQKIVVANFFKVEEASTSWHSPTITINNLTCTFDATTHC